MEHVRQSQAFFALAGLSKAKLQPEMMSGCYQLSVLAQAFCSKLR